MEKERKKYLAIIIVGVALMFLWIGIFAFLVPVDIDEFNKTQSILFGIMIALELITVIATMIVANYYGKKYNAHQQEVLANSDKKQARHVAAVYVISYLAGLGAVIAGIFIKRFAP